MGSRTILDEKQIHLVFDVSLFLKGAFAFFEIVGGILAYFVPKYLVLAFVATLTQAELIEDPRDLIANYILRSAEHLVSAKARPFRRWPDNSMA